MSGSMPELVRRDANKVSVWLLPGRADSQWLEQLISTLASRYGAPRFEPHVTVYAGEPSAGGTEVLGAALAAIAAGTAPFALTLSGIGHSEAFTKTLYLDLESHPSLEELYRRVKGHFATSSHYALKPHLSLIYARLTSSQRAACVERLSMRKSRICFDALQAVHVPQETASLRDVENWQKICSAALGA